ncbi:MAG: 30S ribosomal protein S20 [Sumerlaeia bacterium]
MPNKKSAIKRVRQSEKRRARNRSRRSEMRTWIKKVHAAAEEGNIEAAEANLREAQSQILTAAKGPVIKKHTASRTISRLAAVVNKAKAATAAS